MGRRPIDFAADSSVAHQCREKANLPELEPGYCRIGLQEHRPGSRRGELRETQHTRQTPWTLKSRSDPRPRQKYRFTAIPLDEGNKSLVYPERVVP